MVLDVSEVGEVVAIVRRSGKDWFLEVISEHARNIELPLDFLGKGNYTFSCVADVQGDQHRVEQRNGVIAKGNKIKIDLNKTRGFTAHFAR